MIFPQKLTNWLKFIAASLGLVLLVILLLIPYSIAFGAERSLTLSPGSVTFHGTASKAVSKEFANNVGTTTFHPGISLLYKDTEDNMQYGAFYFLDSFGNHAGGLLAGPLWDVLEDSLQVGLIGGVYVREKVPGRINGFPISIKTEDVEIAPLAAGTVSLALPLAEGYDLETNCAMNWLVNNCQVGIRIGF